MSLLKNISTHYSPDSSSGINFAFIIRFLIRLINTVESTSNYTASALG